MLKALLKSSTTISVCFFWSEFLDNSWSNVTSWVSVDFFALKPCCQSYNIWFVSRWVMMFLTTTSSSSLQHMHVNETGLQFDGLYFSLFLKIGTTPASKLTLAQCWDNISTSLDPTLPSHFFQFARHCTTTGVGKRNESCRHKWRLLGALNMINFNYLHYRYFASVAIYVAMWRPLAHLKITSCKYLPWNSIHNF